MDEQKSASRLGRLYAVWLIRLRWLVVAAVGAAAVLATMHLPGLQADAGLQVTQHDAPALEGERRVLEMFGLPLLSPAVLVQRDAQGLGVPAFQASLRQAVATNARTITGGIPAEGIAGALPIPNSPPVLGHPTTMVTYLWGGSALNGGELLDAGRRYGRQLGPNAGVVGVTGIIPVQVEQGRVVRSHLEWVEIATFIAVALILGLAFRSAVAPVITLATAVVAYLITIRLIGESAARLGVSAPTQLEPVVIALTLGITTDYSIFFLSGMRRRVMAGHSPRDALRFSVIHNLPIVLVAGLTVTAGVGSVVVARMPLFKAFGPGLAITVAVALLVSITLVPALLAIFSRFALWPGSRRTVVRVDDMPAIGSRLSARLLTTRAVAGFIALLCLAALIAASLPLSGFRASVASPETLPAGNSVRLASTAAEQGFPPGVLAPTELLVEQEGITGDRKALVALQRQIAAQPGVAVVIGPQQQPIDITAAGLGLFLAPSGNAARYLIVFANKPLAANGLRDLRGLQDAMPALLTRAGLGHATVEYLGAGALGAEFVRTAGSDLIRVGIAVGVVNLVLLIVFLRAIVAPLYLLATNFLSVSAALGLTVLVFQTGLGYQGLIFYAPFAAAVLLVSLGSDYNIFTVGWIWDEARSRSLRHAVAVGSPRRPVTIAGLTLATSFAFVALIPVAPFRQLAFAVAVGVLIDTFLVRSLLVPSLIVLIGRVSGWPGRRLTPRHH